MKQSKWAMQWLTVIMAVVTLTVSCGKKEKVAAKVKPEKTEISGDLSDYLQIVDNPYEISPTDFGSYGGTLSIKIKATKALPEDQMNNKEFTLSAALSQEDGTPVSGSGDFTLSYTSTDKLISLLKKGSGEEIIELSNSLNYEPGKHAEKAKKFSVTSSMKEKEKETISSSPQKEEEKSETEESLTSSDEGSGSGEDFDKMLDDYENFVDEYIKFYKKAMKGDQSALTEYPSLMEKATTLSESMQAAQSANKLTAKQIARYTKIATKLSNAALGN